MKLKTALKVALEGEVRGRKLRYLVVFIIITKAQHKFSCAAPYSLITDSPNKFPDNTLFPRLIGRVKDKSPFPQPHSLKSIEKCEGLTPLLLKHPQSYLGEWLLTYWNWILVGSNYKERRAIRQKSAPSRQDYPLKTPAPLT